MASELALLSLTHLHQLTTHKIQNQHLLNPKSTMWNPKDADEDSPNPKAASTEEDSWEVRAFAEDTGSVMGTTWPPRSYTCAFCRREFRSAQALGGHMNVHRRDRARLHQVVPPGSVASATVPSSNAASSFLVPSRGGLCLLYQLPSPSSSPAGFSACTVESSPSPSTLLSISPYPQGGLVSPLNFPDTDGGARWRRRRDRESDESGADDAGELDLELRLGHGPSPS